MSNQRERAVLHRKCKQTASHIDPCTQDRCYVYQPCLWFMYTFKVLKQVNPISKQLEVSPYYNAALTLTPSHCYNPVCLLPLDRYQKLDHFPPLYISAHTIRMLLDSKSRGGTGVRFCNILPWHCLFNLFLFPFIISVHFICSLS